MEFFFGSMCAKCAHHGKHCKLFINFADKDNMYGTLASEVTRWLSIGRHSTAVQHDEEAVRIKMSFGVKPKGVK